MNKVILIGRLTKDPETRSTSTGKKVSSFSIAISEGKDASGQEITQFFDISCWDKLSEITEKYIKKGMRVAIVGSLKNQSWAGSDGTQRKSTVITARELEILTSKNEMSAMSTSNSQNEAPNENESQSNSSQKQSNFDQDAALPEIDVNDINDINNIQMPF
jgi:single-strand DNA-binding protein